MLSVVGLSVMWGLIVFEHLIDAFFYWMLGLGALMHDVR